MPQPVYRAKHRVDGRLRAAVSCDDAVRDAMRRRRAPTPCADADGLVLRCRGLVRGHHRQGLRHRATVSPRHGGRTSASAHPRPTTNALQQAAYARPRNGYLAHPIAGRRIGRQDSPNVPNGWNSHAGMANRQNGRTDEHTDGQASNQIDRRSGRTDKQPKRIERTDCKYAAQRTARILTVPLGVVSDCMYAAESLGRILTVGNSPQRDCKYANGSLPRVLTVGAQMNPFRA